MKFYNLITEHNQAEIDRLISKMSNTELEIVNSIYREFSAVEYTNELGLECMFAILDEHLVDKISTLYNSYNLKFKLLDFTDKVKYDDHIKIDFINEKGRSVKKDILDLVKKYKSDWISKDDVLDKIIEKGIDSLTDLDLDILSS